jgi:hypothetical protein
MQLAVWSFDILLANPPYVRMELFKDIKPDLRAHDPHVHSDRADLYCYLPAGIVASGRDSQPSNSAHF